MNKEIFDDARPPPPEAGSLRLPRRSPDGLCTIEPFTKGLERFQEMFKAAQTGRRVAPKEIVGFTSLEAARNFLTRERLGLLRTIKARQPRSLYELANMAGRDLKGVQEDIRIGSEDLRRNRNYGFGVRFGVFVAALVAVLVGGGVSLAVWVAVLVGVTVFVATVGVIVGLAVEEGVGGAAVNVSANCGVPPPGARKEQVGSRKYVVPPVTEKVIRDVVLLPCTVAAD